MALGERRGREEGAIRIPLSFLRSGERFTFISDPHPFLDASSTQSSILPLSLFLRFLLFIASAPLSSLSPVHTTPISPQSPTFLSAPFLLPNRQSLLQSSLEPSSSTQSPFASLSILLQSACLQSFLDPPPILPESLRHSPPYLPLPTNSSDDAAGTA